MFMPSQFISQTQVISQMLPEFLHSIGRGDQNKAEGMLKKHKQLVLLSGTLIDCAGRQFEKITGLQYAVWALDWHMWEMLKKYMSKEEIQKQLQELNQGQWITKYGKIVSWEQLTEALKFYANNCDKWDCEQSNEYWCKKVGGAQLTLPAHVIQEYNRKDRTFYPCPEFKERFLPRYEDLEIEEWFKQKSGLLGFDFAWVRGEKDSPVMWQQLIRLKGIVCAADQEALTMLFNVRLQQYIDFIKQYDIKKEEYNDVTHSMQIRKLL